MPRGPSATGDADVGALYRVPPAEFVAARDELARQRAQAGDAAGAAVVKKLRKPSVAAWALNSLAQSRAPDVRELIEVSQRLRDAQRRALTTGKGDALRAAGAERHALVRQLTRAALALLESTGHGSGAAAEPAIAATLQAVAVDDEVAAALAAGRLATTAEAAGFGDVSGLSLAPPPAERAPATGRRAPDGKEKDSLAARAEERARRKAELLAEAKAARKEAERSAITAGRLEKRAAAAAEAAEEASRQASELLEAGRRARGDADVAARAAAAADKRRRSFDDGGC